MPAGTKTRRADDLQTEQRGRQETSAAKAAPKAIASKTGAVRKWFLRWLNIGRG